jgi:hypothetical protein
LDAGQVFWWCLMSMGCEETWSLSMVEWPWQTSPTMHWLMSTIKPEWLKIALSSLLASLTCCRLKPSSRFLQILPPNASHLQLTQTSLLPVGHAFWSFWLHVLQWTLDQWLLPSGELSKRT